MLKKRKLNRASFFICNNLERGLLIVLGGEQYRIPWIEALRRQSGLGFLKEAPNELCAPLKRLGWGA